MEQAQLIIEEWLSECRHRTMYDTPDILDRLNKLTEMITEPEAQTVLIAWRESVELSEYHSASRVSDNLLDMYGPILRANSQVVIEV